MAATKQKVRVGTSGGDNMHFWVNRANCDTSTKIGMGHLYGH